MSIRPRFVNGTAFSGFDKEAHPPWLMVRFTNARRFSQRLFLVNGDRWVVESHNSSIASLAEDTLGIPNIFNGREFSITGESPGVTFIEGFLHHDGKIPVARLLEVSVKDERSLSIAFHFVTDDLFTATNRPATIADELLLILNDIFGNQANVTFTTTRKGAAQVSTNLLLIVTADQPNEDGILKHHREWDKLLVARDPTADINVFFMPWGGSKDRRPTRILGLSGDFVCPDEMLDDEVKVALQHEIGRFLGCDVTYDEKRSQHLMFWRRAEGINPDPGNGFASFISKDCANTMNP
jgi:hypothetical protein